MNTNTLYNSSLGRIYMMLRADLVSTKRSLITLMLSLITLVYFLPRLTILTNLNYTNFLEEWANTYKLVAVDAVMMIATTIYFWIYVNRRIVHSQPTLFSTLPAKLWEKLVSLGLYAVILSLLCQVAARIEFLAEYLTVPAMPWAESFGAVNLLPMFSSEIFQFLQSDVFRWALGNTSFSISVLILCLSLGAWAYLHLSLFTAMIYIRHAFIGLFVHFIATIQCIALWGSISSNYFKRFGPANVEELSLLRNYLVFTNLYVWGLAVLLFYLSYRKLRRISS